MANKKMIELGECRSAIRDLFEYGLKRKAEVGARKGQPDPYRSA